DDAPETPCALFGVFAPLAGIVGCMQAAAALKLLAAPHLSKPGRLLLIEARKMEIREVRVPRDPECPVCGK
ncbi:MAG: ThiF family adenylyltransferase, partial [Gammaproteobacteria bacterium]